ncbi:MAG: translation elongation factor Ts [Pseudomonadales bacterium]
MPAITAAMVKELRERTGLGMMDCKKALVEADGDAEKAIEALRKSSGMKAAKKAGRTASDGLVSVRVADDGSYGIVVEVNCETDFAARDDNFVGFVKAVADRVFEERESELETLLDSGLEKQREELVQKIGENISVRRAQVVYADGGRMANYVHTNGKIAVLVAFEGGNEELGRDIAMHIAAANPSVVNPDDAPEDLVGKERDIYKAQAEESGKPPEIIEKMVEGRIRKFLAEISLVEQAFVKDADKTVGQLLKEHGARIKQFIRYEAGEGIEKVEEDFAAEVAKQLG